jgi:ParB family chromosome partitioning protein
MSTYSQISLSDIIPDPNQPRKFFDPAALAELTESIISHGVIQPILVRTVPGSDKYMLVYGERRYRASLDAGISDIPVIIKTMTDSEALEVQIIENLQRKDVHPIEEALAFSQLNEKYSTDEIAQRMGRSIKFVQQRIRITTLSSTAQQLFYEDSMTLKQALTLASIDQASQDEIIASRLENRTPDDKEWKIGNIDYLVERKIHTLDGSHFDPGDDKLYPVAGACTNCPHNTANNPTLFDDDSKFGERYPSDKALAAYFFDGEPDFTELIKLFIHSSLKKEGTADRSLVHRASYELASLLQPTLLYDCSIMIADKATKRLNNLQAKIDKLS